jgi:hypothetical protein
MSSNPAQQTSVNSRQFQHHYIEPIRTYFPFYYEYRVISGLVLFPILFLSGVVVAYNVKVDPDYSKISDFIPFVWILFIPIVAVHVGFSTYLAWLYPRKSQIIVKYKTHKMIPIPSTNYQKQVGRAFVFFSSGLIQFVLRMFFSVVFFCCFKLFEELLHQSYFISLVILCPTVYGSSLNPIITT